MTERFIKLIKAINEKKAKEKILHEDIEFVLQEVKNDSLRDYFFHDLRNPSWAPILFDNGYLTTPPELEEIRKKKSHDISQKTLWKARAVMARIGIIERRNGTYWKLSSRFGKSLINLSDKVNQFMLPNNNPEQERKEWFLLHYM